MELRLNSFENSKRSLARVIREYSKDSMESGKFRDLVYALNVYLGFWKHEADLRIEDDLEAIKDILRKEGKL